jgi:hypothetical protein
MRWLIFLTLIKILQIHEGHWFGDVPSEGPWINLVSLIIANFHYFQRHLITFWQTSRFFFHPKYLQVVCCGCQSVTTRQCDRTLLMQSSLLSMWRGIILAWDKSAKTVAWRRSYCYILRIEGATWSAWRIPTAVFSAFKAEAANFSFK